MEQLLKSIGRCLRVLSLSESGITKLTDSIGDLKHLRYLNLTRTKIEEIPDTVCNLYNLETLILIGCERLTRLPENIGNLINLRHLINLGSGLKEMPLQTGKIKTLQRIDEFVLGKNSGSHIKLLKELQDLSGSLWIKGLENVADVNDVLEADLKNKKFLSKLSLEWEGFYVADDSNKEKQVLGALEPHVSLEVLFVWNYKGTIFPHWVVDNSFSNIVTVSLDGCNDCFFLPPLGQLPSLKDLYIWHFRGLERINSEFYYSDRNGFVKPFRSLESLVFGDMPKLQEWLFIEGDVEGGVFPRLKTLHLYSCPKLKVSLPDYLPSLKELGILGCDKLLALVPRGQQMDTAFPSLEAMRIDNCDGQELFLEGGLPSSLKELSIWNCQNLTALDEESFQRLTSLQNLEILRCNKLRCLPKGLPTSLSRLTITDYTLLLQEGCLPSSLKELCISHCDELTSFDEEIFHRLNSLEKLKIGSCNNLRCLPKRLPTTLSHLSIEHCDLLTPRLQRETGEDWPIVAHIKNLNIWPKPEEKEQSPHPKP